MTNKARGTYLELQTKAALEPYGWVVVKAGGSLGPADLVAMRAGKRDLLIQCKVLGPGRTMPRVDPGERMDLWRFAQAAGGRALIATRYVPGVVTLMELPGPHWTRYPLVDELKVPGRPGKGAQHELESNSGIVAVPHL